jgi:hypothetical protein
MWREAKERAVMSIVIFYINKESGMFRSYQIIKNKTMEEITSGLENYNKNEKSRDVAVPITDQHVVDAICQHYEMGDIRSIVRDVKEQIREFADQLEEAGRALCHRFEEVEELVKEVDARATETAEQNRN